MVAMPRRCCCEVEGGREQSAQRDAVLITGTHTRTHPHTRPPSSLRRIPHPKQKGMESPVVGLLCLVGAVACLGQAALAGPAQWNTYFKLLEESRWVAGWGSVQRGAGWGRRAGCLCCGSACPPVCCLPACAPQTTPQRRFINVMSTDFLCLTALAPFWMSNDAQLRGWDKRDTLVPLLSVLPVVGPALYLCLRPRAQL